MPTPSWPKPETIGPHGFSFPSTFQDSFLKPIQIDELDEAGNTDEANMDPSEKNRLDRLRKGSALTVNIPQSSGYDSYDENPKDLKRYTMDIEQDNHDNSLHEQKQFLDCSDGHDEEKRRNKRRNKCYWSKCRIAWTFLIASVVLFIVIFGAIYLAKHLDSDNDTDSDDISTKQLPVQIVTTPKSQIITDMPPSIDPSNPIVAIRMVVDEQYVESGKDHLVLWRKPQGTHINQGITYNNGSFKVPLDGYYTFTSTLMFDTRVDDLESDIKEIRFHHCVHINNTQTRECSTNGIPVNAIRSDIVHASWIYMSAGQEVYVTISQVGFISDTSDSNTFTMSLMSKKPR